MSKLIMQNKDAIDWLKNNLAEKISKLESLKNPSSGKDKKFLWFKWNTSSVADDMWYQFARSTLEDRIKSLQNTIKILESYPETTFELEV